MKKDKRNETYLIDILLTLVYFLIMVLLDAGISANLPYFPWQLSYPYLVKLKNFDLLMNM